MCGHAFCSMCSIWVSADRASFQWGSSLGFGTEPLWHGKLGCLYDMFFTSWIYTPWAFCWSNQCWSQQRSESTRQRIISTGVTCNPQSTAAWMIMSVKRNHSLRQTQEKNTNKKPNHNPHTFSKQFHLDTDFSAAVLAVSWFSHGLICYAILWCLCSQLWGATDTHDDINLLWFPADISFLRGCSHDILNV